MHALITAAVLVFLGVGANVLFPPIAAAESGQKLGHDARTYYAKAWRDQRASSARSEPRRVSGSVSGSSRPRNKAQIAQVALIKKEAATIQTAFLDYSACMNSMQPAIDHGTTPFCKLSFPAAAKAA